MMFTVRAFTVADTASVELIMTICTKELRTIYSPKAQVKNPAVEQFTLVSRLVAVDDTNTLVGVAEYSDQTLFLYVQGVAVAPTHRRLGVASALITHIANIALHKKIPALRVATIKETGNVAIFKQLGFVVMSEKTSERFYGQDGKPATEVLLIRELEF